MNPQLYKALKDCLFTNPNEVKQTGIVRDGDIVRIQNGLYLFGQMGPKMRGFMSLRGGNRWHNFIEAPSNSAGYNIKDFTSREVIQL